MPQGTVEKQLNGRTALISGAASDIGQAIAHHLVQAGAEVACLDIKPADPLVEAIAAAGDRAMAYQCDVADSDAVASAVEAVACIKTIETGIFPPTINLESQDPECDIEIVANHKREGKADVVLNNALAFGGYDAVMALARPGVFPDEVGHL